MPMVETKKELEEIDRIDTVYLLGAGCVNGAWPIVLRAASRYAETTLDKDDCDWWFTATTQYLHFISAWKDLDDDQLHGRFGDGDHNSSRRKLTAQQKLDTEKHAALQKAIADELHGAHERNELSLKEPLLELLAVHAGEGSTAILTTNWDLCLEKELDQPGEKAKVVHLHGDIRKPTGMLLPGERPEERFRQDADNAGITHAYWTASLMFDHARRIYVAGLSLSLLDAALGTLLGMGCSKRQPGEIFVVNLPGDSERIARKVQLLVPSGWKITLLYRKDLTPASK
jgi:hypothetical protein